MHDLEEPFLVSRWYESIDRRPGRPPAIFGQPDGSRLTFELGILGGVLRDELFVPTPRTRLVIRCDRDGAITLRIAEGRTSGT